MKGPCTPPDPSLKAIRLMKTRSRNRKRKKPRRWNRAGNPIEPSRVALHHRDRETGGLSRHFYLSPACEENPDSGLNEAQTSNSTPSRPHASTAALPAVFIDDRFHALVQQCPTPVPAPDQFENSSFLSRSATIGEEFANVDHSHDDRQGRSYRIPALDLEILRISGAFDLPRSALRQCLLEAFCDKCYTWSPVADPLEPSGVSQGGQISLLVLQALLLAGSAVRPGVCPKEDVDLYYGRVRTLITTRYERNPLNIVVALCLLQWHSPAAPTHISTDTPRFWTTYGVGLAQQMGLHHQPAKDDPMYKLRRRIWWTLYVSDPIFDFYVCFCLFLSVVAKRRTSGV